MGAVLIRIVEHLRVRDQFEPATGLRHVLLIEEAHRLLKNVTEGAAAAAVELFASLLAGFGHTAKASWWSSRYPRRSCPT